jgi:hypothetical protein
LKINFKLKLGHFQLYLRLNRLHLVLRERNFRDLLRRSADFGNRALLLRDRAHNGRRGKMISQKNWIGRRFPLADLHVSSEKRDPDKEKQVEEKSQNKG